MNATEELKPCPFCGGEAYIHEHYAFGGYVPKEYPNNEPLGYAVGCSKYDCRGKRENTGFLYDTEAEAIEAWNTRTPEKAIAATLGDEPKSMRVFDSMETALTIAEKEVEIEKLKRENAELCDENAELTHRRAELEAATLGGGKLTAEQVRECTERVYLEGYSDGSVNRGAHIEETDWQAIADELNATLGRGTCEFAEGGTVSRNYINSGEEGSICPVPRASVIFEGQKLTFDSEDNEKLVNLVEGHFRKLAGLGDAR